MNNDCRRRRNTLSRATRRPVLLEALERRQLLSGSVHTVHAGITTSPALIPVNQVQGYTPAQIRKAYGIDQFTFNGQTVAADGTGQTICIVDPFNDPNIRSDLDVFDAQFGIAAPPSLTVVDHQGGSHLPATNGSWAGEISTDVEWAHAVAPGADILVVEAINDNTDNLVDAVDYARHVANVAVISISWGGTEFPGQLAYDPKFATVAGHTPLTVLVAAGDTGAAAGPQWPSSSKNVLSIGGSVLTLADTSGTYGSETSWTDTSSGYSRFESEPSWQQVVQRSGARSVPDVSINADTNIGQALYDTVPFQGVSGWQTTNGTSVGTPEWAGLVAIANQGRALQGLPTLDGVKQVAPLLYSLYGAPGTAAYSSYVTHFNDITVPQNPAARRAVPTAGYDIATGLGTPKASVVINDLLTSPDASALTDPTQPLASQLTVSFTKLPKASDIGGAAGTVTVVLSNLSKTRFADGVTLTLSSEPSIADTADATVLTTVTLPNLVLGSHGARSIKLSFAYPTVATPTQLFMSAQVTTATGNTVPADAVTTSPITVGPSFIQLNPTFVGGNASRILAGKKQMATVIITNAGNIPATGSLSVNLFESSDQVLDPTDTMLGTSATRPIKLRAGGVVMIRVAFIGPMDLPPGSFYLIASITTDVAGMTGNAVIATRS